MRCHKRFKASLNAYDVLSLNTGVYRQDTINLLDGVPSFVSPNGHVLSRFTLWQTGLHAWMLSDLQAPDDFQDDVDMYFVSAWL